MHTSEFASSGHPDNLPADCARDAGWPTTLRFSRRVGEAIRGADFAAALERPPLHQARNRFLMFVGVVASVAVMFALQSM